MNKAEVIFRNPETDQKIIMNFEESVEEQKLNFNVNVDPPIMSEEQEIGLIGVLAEVLLASLHSGQPDEQIQ